VICVTHNKMVDGSEDEHATFQFIEEIQNFPDLPAAYKDTKKAEENGRTSGETGLKRW